MFEIYLQLIISTRGEIKKKILGMKKFKIFKSKLNYVSFHISYISIHSYNINSKCKNAKAWSIIIYDILKLGIISCALRFFFKSKAYMIESTLNSLAMSFSI